MKVLFDCQLPSLLAHGGAQIQIDNTVAGLRQIGVEADYLRWWDPEQPCDIIHFVGRLNDFYLGFARSKGIKVVICELLTSQGSRNRLQRLPHWALRQCDRLAGGRIGRKFGWNTYRLADACIANTAWEAHLMQVMFGAPPEKVHVVPNGVEEVFFADGSVAREGDYLVCTATITERKRVLKLAEAAVQAGTPVRVVGKPYAESDPYFQQFLHLHRSHPRIVRYDGPVNDRVQMARIYQEARGFVLLSTMETRSLSSEEAAAAECPLLLSDLPWARNVFQETAAYCPVSASTEATAAALREFYDQAPRRPRPLRPKTWVEVAGQFHDIYRQILQPR